MLRPTLSSILRNKVRNTALYNIQIAILSVATIMPLAIPGTADAAQLTSRSVAISTSKPGATANYNFSFNVGSSTTVQSFIIQFCDTPLGSCTRPGAASGGEINIASATATTGGSAGLGAVGTKTTSNTNLCSDANVSMICYPLTSSTAGSGAATISVSGIVNPTIPTTGSNVNYVTVYARISLFTTNDYTSPAIHEGTVATSINKQLTVNGRVQEKLDFCVAAVPDDGASDTNTPKNITECGAVASTVVDIGIIDSNAPAISPVDNNPPTSQGNDMYGMAMVSTNASSGVAITYFAEPDTTSGAAEQLRAFRVPGAVCNAAATNLLDQCFQSADSAGAANFSVAGEGFGMNIPCKLANDGTNSTTDNLTPAAAYVAGTITPPGLDCENTNTSTRFAWNPTSTAVALASSSTVVDNEAVKLNFGARSAPTTPTGSYTVVSTYIATPTF